MALYYADNIHHADDCTADKLAGMRPPDAPWEFIKWIESEARVYRDSADHILIRPGSILDVFSGMNDGPGPWLSNR